MRLKLKTLESLKNTPDLDFILNKSFQDRQVLRINDSHRSIGSLEFEYTGTRDYFLTLGQYCRINQNIIDDGYQVFRNDGVYTWSIYKDWIEEIV